MQTDEDEASVFRLSFSVSFIAHFNGFVFRNHFFIGMLHLCSVDSFIYSTRNVRWKSLKLLETQGNSLRFLINIFNEENPQRVINLPSARRRTFLFKVTEGFYHPEQ